MKYLLRNDLVRKLTLDKMPVSINDEGKLVFIENTKLTPYILYDSHRDAPTGFAVKVAKTKSTYIVQLRVGKKNPIKFKVGNIQDFHTIDEARKAAISKVQEAKRTNRNPNEIKRTKLANEYTFIKAVDIYKNEHLLKRSQPAAENTIKTLDKGIRKLSDWHDQIVNDISPTAINSKFDLLFSVHPTATEQAFRWATAAVNYLIEREVHLAKAEKREPSITYNPFSILSFNNKFRTKSQLEASYKVKDVRKPLNDVDLGKWINSLMKRRQLGSPGADYLLLTTFWGSRKTEAFKLKWKQHISKSELANSSYVDLENEIVVFKDTKNKKTHELPLTTATMNILNNRFYSIDKNNKNLKWVFPAVSKYSKVGYYSDSSEFLKRVCIESEINVITMHDLRRTFGRIAEPLTSYRTVKRLLNHSGISDPTTRYTEGELNHLKKELEKIDLYILERCPSAYNELLFPKYSKIPE